MEQKLKQRVADYLVDYKQHIQEWLKQNNTEIVDKTGTNKTNAFLEYIYDFPPLEISKHDFQKRLRTKNNIPNYERCCALRLNGERCTRKKKDKSEFCGTHLKGIPYGSIEEKPLSETIKVEVWLEEINGIHQYIDKNGLVYSTEDIHNSVKKPRIIAKWNKDDKNEYFIVNN